MSYENYFTNSIINFDEAEYTDDLGVSNIDGAKTTLIARDYHSVDFCKITEFLDACPSEWFKWTKIYNNTTLEKLSQDLYDSPNYWDVLLVVNRRMPLFEFPYDYDIVELIVDDMLDKYLNNVYKREMSTASQERLREVFLKRVTEDNEVSRYIRYVIPQNLYDFILAGREYGFFKEG